MSTRTMAGGAAHPPAAAGRLRLAVACAAIVLSWACDLDDVVVAEPSSRVVAEVYAVVVDQEPPRVRALLHRTPGGGPGTVPGARIIFGWEGRSAPVELQPLFREACLVAGEGGETFSLPDSVGTCYGLDGSVLFGLGPADSIGVRIDLPGGGTLRGGTRMPGSFRLHGVPGETDTCYLPPATPLPLAWSPSPNAWAYTTETLIFGIESALASRGIEVPSDPLFLLGLSISQRDTTLSYPSEVGVFDRADLNRDLATILQEGLPEPVDALIGVGALDQNYANWIRGGNFNPSGQIRIPSLHGTDRGTGVLGAAVVRTFRAGTANPNRTPCLPA